MPFSPDVSWSSSFQRGATPPGPRQGAVPTDLAGLDIRLERVTVLEIRRGRSSSTKSADVLPLLVVLAPGAEEPLLVRSAGPVPEVRPGQDLRLPAMVVPVRFRSVETRPPWLDIHVVLVKTAQRDAGTAVASALASPTGRALRSALGGGVGRYRHVPDVTTPLAEDLLVEVCAPLHGNLDAPLAYLRASVSRIDGYCLGDVVVLTDHRHAVVDLRVAAGAETNAR